MLPRIENNHQIVTASPLKRESTYYSTRLVIRFLSPNASSPYLVCFERLLLRSMSDLYVHTEFFESDWFKSYDDALNFFWKRIR